MIYLIVGILACATLAVFARRILAASIWMAALSALLSAAFYMLGAQQVAVIELSVGTGLVTVLFVFAMSLTGDHDVEQTSGRSHLQAAALIVFLLALVGWFILPLEHGTGDLSGLPIEHLLWTGRVMDVFAQVVLIFAGVLGVMGLLVELREAQQTLSMIEEHSTLYPARHQEPGGEA